MNIKELKPNMRTFAFVPTESDGLSRIKYNMRVFLGYDDYILRVQSAYYAYHIPIKRHTGDVCRDLIMMTQDDLLSQCSLEKSFLLEESKNLVLKNIENACVDLCINIHNEKVQNAIDQIQAIDEDYFFEDIEAEYNSEHFVRIVRDIIRCSPLRDEEDNIAKSVTEQKEFAKVSVDMIIKHLYPILQREVNLKSDEITKEEIVSGLQNGIVRIINNASDRCISAMIGEHWFYFTGMEDESMDAELYLKRYNYDEIAAMIHDTINQAPIKDAYDDTEWRYYKCILNRA